MSLKNQITVDFEGEFLKIVNVDGVNPNYYRLDGISHVHSRYLDMTAVNTYSPGFNEFNEDLLMKFRSFDSPTENVFEQIQIHNVTNQPTWTKDKAGLYKAISDLLLVSGGGGITSSQPQLDMSTIVASSEVTDIPFYTTKQWSIQFVWASLSALDGTIDLEVSNDGSNFEALDGFTQIVMTPASDSASVSGDNFDFNYLRIIVTANSVVSGTVDKTIKR